MQINWYEASSSLWAFNFWGQGGQGHQGPMEGQKNFQQSKDQDQMDLDSATSSATTTALRDAKE